MDNSFVSDEAEMSGEISSSVGNFELLFVARATLSLFRLRDTTVQSVPELRGFFVPDRIYETVYFFHNNVIMWILWKCVCSDDQHRNSKKYINFVSMTTFDCRYHNLQIVVARGGLNSGNACPKLPTTLSTPTTPIRLRSDSDYC